VGVGVGILPPLACAVGEIAKQARASNASGIRWKLRFMGDRRIEFLAGRVTVLK
jgi:hypothetical protein